MNVAGWLRRLVSPAEVQPRDTVLAFVRDPLWACLLEAALRPSGFDVLLAATVEDGIVAHWQRLREIALVVLCEPMPGLTRRQLLEGLRGIDPAVPCCVWDADDDSSQSDTANPAVVTILRPATVGEIQHNLFPMARRVGRAMALAY